MTNANDWDSDALALLGNVTRELKFDWSAIAEKIKKFFEATETFIEVSPAICRQQYAKDYSKKSVKVEAVVVQEVEVVTVTNEAPAELVSILKTSESLVSENYSSTISTQQIYEKYNEMTVEELIIHCDEKEKVMNQRKEQIFQNVLNSLGGMKNEDFENQTGLLQEIHEMKQKYYQQLEEKELDKLEKKQLALELLEKQTLEEERAKLKRRFDLHSEDNIGENPFEFDSMLSNHNNSSSINNIGGINNSKFDVVSSDKLLSAGTSTTVATADNTNLTTPTEVSVNLEGSIFSYGGSEEQFDSILSELERELEQKALVRAQSKGNLIGDSEETSAEDDTPASELWEVLSVLELAAKQNQHKKSTATTTGNNNTNSNGNSGSNSSSISNTNSSAAHNKTIAHYLAILNDSSDIIAADKKNASVTSAVTTASNTTVSNNASNNNKSNNSTSNNSRGNVKDEYYSDNDATVAPAKSSPLRSTSNVKTAATTNYSNSTNFSTTTASVTNTVNSNRIDYYSDQSDGDGKDNNRHSGSDDSDDEDWKSARLKGKNRANQYHNSGTVTSAGGKTLPAVPDMTGSTSAVLPPQPPLTVPVTSSNDTKSISFSATNDSNDSVSNEEKSADLLSVIEVPAVAESPVYLPPPVVVKTGSLGIYSTTTTTNGGSGGDGSTGSADVAVGGDNSISDTTATTATITPVKRVKGKLGGIMNNTSRNNRKANTGATTESVADDVV